MSYFIKLGLVLLIITAIASGILAFVDSLTSEKIRENKNLAEEEARRDVLPEAVRFQLHTTTLEAQKEIQNPLKNAADTGPRQFIYYLAYDDNDELVGYSFVASKYGYSSQVKTMVGVNTDMKILKIKVIEQAETPGLGANAASDDFQNRFLSKSISQLKVDKDGGDIKSLTGATITSKAVCSSIEEGLHVLIEAVGREE
jgi:Na+-translocating ferredoxin:NAD+ oxidoreductase subunit G